MAEYKTYPKIHRLGKEETDGLLEHEVIVQEKVDGANISIFWQDGEVRCGTRTRMLPIGETFNGFQDAVQANSLIKDFLEANQDLILFGEWLVKHTITYPDEAYRKIYLFDIFHKDKDGNVIGLADQEMVKLTAESLGLEYPHVFAKGKLTQEQIAEFVGKSNIAPAGEGVVIKANSFINKYGNHTHAKLVHEKFKEHNAIVFGGNNKHSESYWEMYVVNKYATTGRVQKIMQKIQSETDHRLDMPETSRVAQTCYYDMITEEIWEIVKKVPALNLKLLQSLSMRKFIQIYHDILNNSVSIADAVETQKESNTNEQE